MNAIVDARLLCAARRSYAIVATGPAPADPEAACVDPGFTAPPQGYAGGPEGRDAAMLGLTPDRIILAFRGTLPPTDIDNPSMPLDWLNDADLVLVPWDDPALTVHKGFKASIDDLWTTPGADGKTLADAIAAMAADNPDLPFSITGHSKGGALANLAAMRLKIANPISVRTFAAARPGGKAFAAAYAARITDSVRYEYGDDIVPHLPPGLLFGGSLPSLDLFGNKVTIAIPDYASVGTLCYIPRSGPMTGDKPGLEAWRAAHIALEMANPLGGITTIIGDHSLGGSSGYANAVCAAAAA